MEFEDILLDVGDYGRYQKNMIWIFLLPAASLLPWFTMNIMFMVSVPDHWCNVPELMMSNLSLSQQRRLISPLDEKCRMYNLNFSEMLSTGDYSIPNGTETIPCTNGWNYDTTHYESTAASKWNMVCDDAHYVSLVLTLFNVGSIIGTPIYGALSDRIGRKITFFVVLIVTAVTALASVFMSNFTVFIVLKTINGSLMPCVFQLPFIIILEIVAPEMRTRMNGLVNCSWTFGMSFLPLVAYLSRDWIVLGVITSSVIFIYFFYWTFLPESPRWLVSVERYEEAADVLMKIGDKNGKPQEKSQLISKLKKLGEKMKKEKEVDGVQNSSMDIIRYAQLRKKFIIITFCWMSNIMAYYGLQLNVSNLAGNEFINFFLLSLVEIPGYLTNWYFMEKFGRRWCCSIGFILIGIVCMVQSIKFQHSDVILSMIGKFFASGTFMATYQQSSELYPTVVRSLAMGLSSTVASIAMIIVPYLVFLSVYGKAIPFVIIGMSAIIAGVLASFLPETLNENLPQTIFDAEQFGRNQKYLSWNRRRRSVSRERAASFGLKIKPIEIVESNENASKSQRSSAILQNVEFMPGHETADSNKISNGGLHKGNLDNKVANQPNSEIRYRNTSTDSQKEIQNLEKEGTSATVADDSNRTELASQYGNGKEKLAYVNAMFDKNDIQEEVSSKSDDQGTN